MDNFDKMTNKVIGVSIVSVILGFVINIAVLSGIGYVVYLLLKYFGVI